MSDTEAIMWAVEKDPALRSDFMNITVLDGLPDETRLRSKVEHALATIPRLRQRVVSPPLRLAPPEWRDDPTLDLEYHLRRVAVPSPGGMRELLDLSSTLASMPLDRSRPLWAFTLVEGLEGGRAALLQQVHHTITDGVGGLRLSLSLVDLEPDPEPVPPPARSATATVADEVAAEAQTAAEADPIARTTPIEVVGDAVVYSARSNARLAGAVITALARTARHPAKIGGRAGGAVALARSVRRQVLVTDAARSPLMSERSLGRHFEVVQLPLDRAKTAAGRLGGTLNDLYVTGVAGALGIYHERMGVSCDELRMAMPVSLRDGASDAGSNAFAPTRVVVPVQPKEPVPRFAAVHQALAGLRAEPVLSAVGPLSALLAPLPTAVLVNMARSQSRTIDFATSNLRGSPVALYLGGRRIEASFPMGPRSGVPLNATLLSYSDSLDIGINLDPVSITDPPALMAALDESFGALLE